MSEMLLAVDFHLDVTKEIVIVTPNSRSEAEPLLAPLRMAFVPNRVDHRRERGRQPEASGAIRPVARGKRGARRKADGLRLQAARLRSADIGPGAVRAVLKKFRRSEKKFQPQRTQREENKKFGRKKALLEMLFPDPCRHSSLILSLCPLCPLWLELLPSLPEPLAQNSSDAFDRLLSLGQHRRRTPARRGSCRPRHRGRRRRRRCARARRGASNRRAAFRAVPTWMRSGGSPRRSA